MTSVKTLLIGDTHADVEGYRDLIAEAEGEAGRRLPSIHVGDYGFGWFSPSEERQVEGFHRRNRRHRFLRGNHDDPELAAAAPGWLPDGAVSGEVLFLGGADGALRGADPQISEARMREILADLRARPQKPSVVVSHDAPQEAAQRLHQATQGLGAKLKASRTRRFLSEVLSLLRPELWIFGHWHVAWSGEIEGTRFEALGFAEGRIFDLPWIPDQIS